MVSVTLARYTPGMTGMTYIPKTRPYDHQTEALAWAHPRDRFALFMEMGTGKTKVVIDDFCWRFAEESVDCLIILAPMGVFRNWSRREIPKHMPDAYASQAVIKEWKSSSRADGHPAHFEQLFTERRVPRVLVVNVESFSSSSRSFRFVDRLLQEFRCYVAVDESTTIRNESSSKTKAVIQLGRRPGAVVKTIMTGFEAPNGPMNIWSQFEFLGSDLLGFSNFFSFRARYAVLKKMRFVNKKTGKPGKTTHLIVNYQNVENLNKKTSPHVFRKLKRECLDLPPKVFMPHRVFEMGPEQRRVYDEMEANAEAQLNELGDFASASIIIALRTRLDQIACGFVVDEQKNLHQFETVRVDETMAALREMNGRIILWARYRHNIRQLVERIEEEYGPQSLVQFHGGTSPRERDAAIDAFQDLTNRVRFFVGNPRVGAMGITLTAADHVVHFSHGDDLEERVQSDDRPHRAGLTHPVSYTQIVAENSTDAGKLRAYEDKIDLASTVSGVNWRQWLR